MLFARNKTIESKVFRSNTFMVLFVLLTFLTVNLVTLKIYSKIVEQRFNEAITEMLNETYESGNDLEEEIEKRMAIEGGEVDDLLQTYAESWSGFFVLFAADGAICIGGLLLISQFFTKRLSGSIMVPLDELEGGARRIRDGNLKTDIHYEGIEEFEHVCGQFNRMQHSILEAQEQNARYEKARTEMIAGISHDLRTPLTAVRGTVKGLMDGVAATPEQQQKFLQRAYQRTEDMEVLLRNLLYLSRVETGHIPLRMDSFDADLFLDGYVKDRQETNEDLVLEFDSANRPVMIWADPDQVVRILDNLLENSKKYADADQLKLRIGIRQSGDRVVIDFSDNGKGVAEDQLENIFEEFYRGDESRNRTKGNGLGLYIVRSLMHGMNGAVTAESDLGMVFHLSFCGGSDDGGNDEPLPKRTEDSGAVSGG